MEHINKIDSVSKYNARFNQESLHPLVSVVDFSKSEPVESSKSLMGIYTIFLKDIKCGNMTYGCSTYDYEEGTLVFIAPGQVVGVEKSGEYVQPKGYALVFHPDLLLGTHLGRHMKDYTFFSYEVNEALHLSERERAMVVDCLDKIQYELEHAIDKHSKTLIVSYIELLLNYCTRFYDRQFITRSVANKDVLSKFENVLSDYFQSEKPKQIGLPTVKYCADELHLSANYLGDLIKKETGKSALDHIQLTLINNAKERMFDTSKTISEIAYELGFQYPQHFSRVFKQLVGSTPMEYRSNN